MEIDNRDIIAVGDSLSPLMVQSDETCAVRNCTRRPLIRARVFTKLDQNDEFNWHLLPLCVWHRMDDGRINGFLFDAEGNLLDKYVPVVIDGLLCYPEQRP